MLMQSGLHKLRPSVSSILISSTAESDVWEEGAKVAGAAGRLRFGTRGRATSPSQVWQQNLTPAHN
jgi:hypothetical protein